MTVRQRRVGLIVTLLLLAGNLVAFNVLIAGWSTARIDLTSDHVFSISNATRRIVTSLDDDLWVYGYFSKRTHPKLSPLVPRIADVLEEYRALSGGRVHVEMIDPGENAVAEQEANDRFGVASTPFRLASKYESGIVNAYFALVIKYGDQYVRYGFDDLIEVEALPDGDVDVRLRNFEYDLTRAIKKVVYGFRSASELFERAGEPVRFTAIMTPDDVPDVFKDVPEAVRKAAAELSEAGGDRFVFEEIVPTDEESRAEVARRFGARPMSLGLFSDAQFYLYGFLQVGDRLEQLLLTRDGTSAATIREAIESSLRRQTPGFLKTVGVVTPQPAIPPDVMRQLQMQGQMPPQPPPEFEQVKRFLRQDYQVRDVGLEQPLASDVDILLVLKPKALSEKAVYNLDQYLMRGGRVVVCSGSYEADFGGQAGLSVRPVDSGLDGWLTHLGVEVKKTLVLDDRNQPLPIPQLRRTAFGTFRTWSFQPYPYLVEVRDEGLLERAITAQLDAVGFYWGSPVQVNPDSTDGLEVIELLKSSTDSWTSNDLTRVASIDYSIPEGAEPRLLAVALQGSFKSYFADHPVPGQAEGDTTALDAVPLLESPETRLTVIGNAEFLSDFVARLLGQQGGFFAQNLSFTQNLIDWMNLDNDLITIRARGTGARRLERIDQGAEVALETLNYLIPILALGAFGVWHFFRRRRVAPIVPPGRAVTPGAP